MPRSVRKPQVTGVPSSRVTGLSPSDAVLRGRITELGVHLRCGAIRGPAPRSLTYDPNQDVLWQSCGCEDRRVRWPGHDVSSAVTLCILCSRGLAGGSSRWSWLACEPCREVNKTVGRVIGAAAPLPLGRHSIMNAVGIQGGSSRVEVDAGVEALLKMDRSWSALSDWSETEFRRLVEAQPWTIDTDVPLPLWQRTFPASAATSRDAFRRFSGCDPASLSLN